MTNIDPIQPPVEDSPTVIKNRREASLIATLGLIAATGAAVGGLVYHAVVNSDQQALTQLGTMATLGFGGLLALSGGKKPSDPS